MAEKSSLRPYKLKQFKYNSHLLELKFIRNANRPLRILDIGTADGYLGAILKQQGRYLVGVERDCSLGNARANSTMAFISRISRHWDFRTKTIRFYSFRRRIGASGGPRSRIAACGGMPER